MINSSKNIIAVTVALGYIQICWTIVIGKIKVFVFHEIISDVRHMGAQISFKDAYIQFKFQKGE